MLIPCAAYTQSYIEVPELSTATTCPPFTKLPYLFNGMIRRGSKVSFADLEGTYDEVQKIITFPNPDPQHSAINMMRPSSPEYFGTRSILMEMQKVHI